MTLKSRIKELEERAEEERRRRSCTCERLIIIEGEPRPEQQERLDALIPCKVHPTVVAVVEVGHVPVRAMEVQEALDLEN